MALLAAGPQNGSQSCKSVGGRANALWRLCLLFIKSYSISIVSHLWHKRFVSDVQTVSHVFIYEGQVKGAGEAGGRQSPGATSPQPSAVSSCVNGSPGQWWPQHSSLGPGRQCLKSTGFQNPDLGLRMDLMRASVCPCARARGGNVMMPTLEHPLRV